MPLRFKNIFTPSVGTMPRNDEAMVLNICLAFI
jgi:hypothetical protein